MCQVSLFLSLIQLQFNVPLFQTLEVGLKDKVIYLFNIGFVPRIRGQKH